MKKSLLFLGLLALLLSSCSRMDSADLLKSVPKDTLYFSVINAKELTSNFQPQEIESLSSRIGDSKYKFLLSKDSGVDFEAPVVVFEYKGAPAATFCLRDEKSFRQGIEAACGSEFKKEGGVDVCDENTVFVKDGRAWVTSEYPAVSAADIAMLASLTEEESVLSIEAAAKLDCSGKEAVAFFNLDKAFAKMGRSDIWMVLNMVFDNLSYITLSTDFKGSEAECDVRFYNYKSQPAPLSFNPSKLSASAIKEFPGKGNFFLALGVNPELMRSLSAVFKSFLSVPSEMMAFLEKLDGEVIISGDFESKFSNPENLSAMFTLKSAGDAEKTAQFFRSVMGSSMGNLKIYNDGKRLFVISGDKGAGSMSDYADDFKGAELGLLFLPSFFEHMDSSGSANDISVCSAVLKDSKKSNLSINFKVNEGENALSVLLRTITEK